MLVSANVMYIISAISLVSKFHIYMIIVLANFYSRYNNSYPNEPFSLKEAMTSFHWKDFEKTMYAKFQFFIKNDI